jgi:hypothetical protein
MKPKQKPLVDIVTLSDFLIFCSPDMPDQPHDCEYLFDRRCPRYATCNVARKAETLTGFARVIDLPKYGGTGLNYVMHGK